MAHKKIAALAILFCSLPLFGQYNDTVTPGIRDNPAADCVTTACWTGMQSATVPSPISVGVGTDGTAMAVGSDHKAYMYDSVHFVWQDLSANLTGLVKGVAVASHDVIYAITTEPTGNVYYLGSSSDGVHWYPMASSTPCVDQIAVTLIGLSGSNPANRLWCISNGVASVFDFTALQWVVKSPTSLLWNIAIDQIGGLIAWGRDGNLWGFNKTAWVNQGHILGFTPRSAPGALAIADDGTVAIVDSGSGVHISRDYGATWAKVMGTGTIVAASSSTLILLGTSASGVYHYAGTMPAVTTGFTGIVHCTPTCAPGTKHHANTQINFGHGRAGLLGSADFDPLVPPPPTSTDYSSRCDPWFYFDTAECVGHYNGEAICPHMGNLFNFADVTPPMGFRILHQKYTYGGPLGSSRTNRLTGVVEYEYYVFFDCINGAPNPLVAAVWSSEVTPAWNTYTLIVGFSSYWKSVYTLAFGTGDDSPIACDSYPTP